MALRTCSLNPQLVAPVDDPEHLSRKAIAPAPSSTEEDRPTRCKQKTLEGEKLKSKLLEEVLDRIETDQNSQTVEHDASKPALEGPVILVKVWTMMEDAFHQLTDRLDAHVIHVTKESLI